MSNSISSGLELYEERDGGGGAKGAEDVCMGTMTVFSCRIGSGKFGRSEQEVKR